MGAQRWLVVRKRFSELWDFTRAKLERSDYHGWWYLMMIRQVAVSTADANDDDDNDDDPLSAISHASSFDLSLYNRVHRPCPRVGHSLSREWPGESSSAPESSKEGRYSSILAHFPGKLDRNRIGLAATRRATQFAKLAFSQQIRTICE